MALSPRASRQNRIGSLCAEIDRLTLCCESLPAGTARDAITEEISLRLDEINDLNRPSGLESSSGQRTAYTVSVLLVMCGLLFGTYVLIGLGALVAFFALVAFDTTPDH